MNSQFGKLFLFFALLLTTASFSSSCTQENQFNGIEPVYENVIGSNSFIAYYQNFNERRSLMQQDVVFDQHAVYSSEEEKSKALDQTIRIAEEKGKLFNKISDFQQSETFKSLEEDQALAETLNFVQRQDIDSKIKGNIIEILKFDATSNEREILSNLKEEFPSLTNEKLVEFLQRFDALQRLN